MKNTLLVVLLPVLFLGACAKQNDIPKPDESGLFIKFFGGAKNDAGYSIKPTPDGGFILVGNTILDGKTDKDAYIVKVDKNGNKLWDRIFGGLYEDEAFDVAVDQLGRYIVVGATEKEQHLSDCFIHRYNAEGVLLDEMYVGDSTKNEQGHFITFTQDGNLLIAGLRFEQTDDSKNMYVVKTDMDSIYWEREIGVGDQFDELGSIVETAEGGFLWCGTVKRGAESNIRVMHTDNYSNIFWDYEYGQFNSVSERGTEINPTLDGHYVISGLEGSTTLASQNILLLKIEASGNLIWAARPGDKGTAANSVIVADDGSLILSGAALTKDGDSNYFIMKTDNTGTKEWYETYGGKGNDRATRVVKTQDSGYLMVGTVEIANNTALGIIKTDKNGKVDKK